MCNTLDNFEIRPNINNLYTTDIPLYICKSSIGNTKFVINHIIKSIRNIRDPNFDAFKNLRLEEPLKSHIWRNHHIFKLLLITHDFSNTINELKEICSQKSLIFTKRIIVINIHDNLRGKFVQGIKNIISKNLNDNVFIISTNNRVNECLTNIGLNLFIKFTPSCRIPRLNEAQLQAYNESGNNDANNYIVCLNLNCCSFIKNVDKFIKINCDNLIKKYGSKSYHDSLRKFTTNISASGLSVTQICIGFIAYLNNCKLESEIMYVLIKTLADMEHSSQESTKIIIVLEHHINTIINIIKNQNIPPWVRSRLQ